MKESLPTVFLPILMVIGFILANTMHFTLAKSRTNVSGILYQDSTWTKANSPYTLTGPVAVNIGATLATQPGADVDLNNYYIQVNGTFAARGENTNPILIG